MSAKFAKEQLITALENVPHPEETSEPEFKAVPLILTNFHNKWLNGVSCEQEIYSDVKDIYNAGVMDCLEQVRKHYGKTNVGEFMKKILKEKLLYT